MGRRNAGVLGVGAPCQLGGLAAAGREGRGAGLGLGLGMSKRATAEGGGEGEQGAPKRTLTKAEAAVYDRQLRVWGVEAQQRCARERARARYCSRGQWCELIRTSFSRRMMESKVLVVGLGGVSCEICKNLILGGVGQVTLMDHQQVPCPPSLRVVTLHALTSQLAAARTRLRRRICRPTTLSPRTASGQM